MPAAAALHASTLGDATTSGKITEGTWILLVFATAFTFALHRAFSFPSSLAEAPFAFTLSFLRAFPFCRSCGGGCLQCRQRPACCCPPDIGPSEGSQCHCHGPASPPPWPKPPSP